MLAFGRDLGAMSKGSTPVSRAGAGLAMRLLRSPITSVLLALLHFWLVLRPWRMILRGLAALSKESVDMRRKSLAGGVQEKPVDILQGFMDAEEPDAKIKLSPHEVQAESTTVMLAGSETTASSIMWTSNMLLLHPETLQRAVNEVRGAFALDHLITYKEVQTYLPYVEACIFEALRYAPITAGVTPRISYKRGITVQGHYIPPGTEIQVNMRSANMHESIWHEPWRFDPDRFLDNNNNNDDDAKGALFTFSYGPRNCIGRKLA